MSSQAEQKKAHRRAKESVDKTSLTIRSLRQEDWPIVKELFGEKGACGGCWCMWWRVEKGGKLWESVKGKKNRDSFKRLIKAKEVHAVLALSGGKPVGWCSFGPRRTFPRLETVRALRRDWSQDTWSIVCFYIIPRWRRHGIATRLLKAATAKAFELGAREVEGYPVVPKKPPKRVPAAFAWTGVPNLFERVGYQELLRTGVSRPIFIRD